MPKDYQLSTADQAKLEAEFQSHVEKTDGHWLWKYPVYQFAGMNANRFAYWFYKGPIMIGHSVRRARECGRRDCVNPDHFYTHPWSDDIDDEGW